MYYDPQQGDFVTTISFTRGRIVKILNTEHGKVLRLRVKDMRSQTLRDMSVSLRAIIRLVRGDADFAVEQKRSGHQLLWPMATTQGEEIYSRYARNRLVQDTHSNGNAAVADRAA